MLKVIHIRFRWAMFYNKKGVLEHDVDDVIELLAIYEQVGLQADIDNPIPGSGGDDDNDDDEDESEEDPDILRTQQLREFAQWAFGNSGLPKLELLVFGEFAPVVKPVGPRAIIMARKNPQECETEHRNLEDSTAEKLDKVRLS